MESLGFVLARYGIFARTYSYKKEPGPAVREFYVSRQREIPHFEITKLVIPPNFVKVFASKIGFGLERKNQILNFLAKKNPRGMVIRSDSQFTYPKICKIKKIGKRSSYCLNLTHHNLLANGVMVKNCDGDEASVTLIMDALLNFSRQYLPAHRGATQDAPLVLTSQLIASEVDDMVFDLDVAWKYPLEFYNTCLEYKKPWDVEIEQVAKRLGTGKEYEGTGYTHETENMNQGVKVSAYKTLPSMAEKVDVQMKIAEKIRAVDKKDVAKLIIEKHFIRDTKGNLRKFSMQVFRCVNCNEKYRRPPLVGKCLKCGGKIIFTISEGGITKYLDLSLKLAYDYDTSPYLKQTLELVKKRVEEIFGKEGEKQKGLSAFIQRNT